MMRRFCGIMAAFALIVSFAAASCEEVFTLHNGTTFGMTKSEVKEKELQAGVTLEEPDGGAARLVWEGQIAGQEFAHLMYYFDNEAELLDELWYSFDYIAGYDTINTGLKKIWRSGLHRDKQGVLWLVDRKRFFQQNTSGSGGSYRRNRAWKLCIFGCGIFTVADCANRRFIDPYLSLINL